MFFENVRCTYFFNSINKIEINFIKNSCTFYMLLKKWTHVPQEITQSARITPNEIEVTSLNFPPLMQICQKKMDTCCLYKLGRRRFL
jgi:hypothetical protein